MKHKVFIKKYSGCEVATLNCGAREGLQRKYFFVRRGKKRLQRKARRRLAGTPKVIIYEA